MKARVTNLLACLLLSTTKLVAESPDPYKEILRSKEMLNLGAAKGAKENAGGFLDGPWFKRNSTYASIFTGKHGVNQLILWVAPPASKYQAASEPHNIKSKLFAGSSASFKVKNSKNIIELSAFTVHPLYVEMDKSQTIPEIADLMPPSLKVESSKEVVIGDTQATQYWHKDDKCSILIKLPQTTYVQAKSHARCYRSDDLLEFAKSLNLQRLIHKLNG